MLLAISSSGFFQFIIGIMVIALICWLLWWLIGYISLPEPFNKVLRVIVAVMAVIFLINALLSLVGKSFIVF